MTELTDNGSTPLLLAVQNKHMAIAILLLAQGASVQVQDKSGDTAFHWAAYVGDADMFRILLYSRWNDHRDISGEFRNSSASQSSGASLIHQVDDHGHTVLHLAVLSGSSDMVKELVYNHGFDTLEFLTKLDSQRRTALDIAHVKPGDGKLVQFLEKQIKRQKSQLRSTCRGLRRVLDGSFFRDVAAMDRIWPHPACVCKASSIMVIGYPLYALLLFPATFYQEDEFGDDHHVKAMHYIYILFNFLIWVMFSATVFSSPGYLKQDSPQYDHVLQQMGAIVRRYASNSAFRDSDDQKRLVVDVNMLLSRLCHTCRLVRPFRAKHCRVCRRCVAEFDHHCPWVSNCIGYGNRHIFTSYNMVFTVPVVLQAYFSYLTWYLNGFSFWLIVSIVHLCFGGSICVTVLPFNLYHMVTNQTTNEHSNFHRYDYLKKGFPYNVLAADVDFKSLDAKGSVAEKRKKYQSVKLILQAFRNPFNRGIRNNILEFYHLVPTQSIEFTNRHLQFSGIVLEKYEKRLDKSSAAKYSDSKFTV